MNETKEYWHTQLVGEATLWAGILPALERLRLSGLSSKPLGGFVLACMNSKLSAADRPTVVDRSEKTSRECEKCRLAAA